jgi:hypothetical protein
MRQNPMAAISALGSLVIYLIIRETGHLISGLVLGIPTTLVLRYGILPGVDVSQLAGSLAKRQEGSIIISGPILALLVGYGLLILFARRRRASKPVLQLFLGILCYLSLILDPIYYAIIPLANLGDEPERVAMLLEVSIRTIQLCALSLLLINMLLIRRKVVPFLKGA